MLLTTCTPKVVQIEALEELNCHNSVIKILRNVIETFFGIEIPWTRIITDVFNKEVNEDFCEALEKELSASLLSHQRIEVGVNDDGYYLVVRINNWLNVKIQTEPGEVEGIHYLRVAFDSDNYPENVSGLWLIIAAEVVPMSTHAGIAIANQAIAAWLELD